MKKKYTIDCSDKDEAYLAAYERKLETFVGSIIEILGEKKELLFSQSIREMILDNAKDLKAKGSKLKYRLRIDNPLNDLE
jgi:hypothetical protein